VRIIPEFDAPAHVGNGWQFPGAEGFTVCYEKRPWYQIDFVKLIAIFFMSSLWASRLMAVKKGSLSDAAAEKAIEFSSPSLAFSAADPDSES